MDLQSLREQYAPLVRQHWLPISLGSLGLIFLVYGLISLGGSLAPATDLEFSSDAIASESASQKGIMVDVEGGVVRPGVYTLSQHARLQDALIAAGGLSQNADRGWVAKNLNLAAKVQDTSKVYVPMVGENTASTAIVGESFRQTNINTATEQELDRLPGIGATTAQKILGSRPYATTDELLVKKVVSKKVFDQIKDKITAY